MSVTWLARQPYAVTEFLEPPAILGFGYEATTAGTSGTVEPAWPLVAGNTVVDGTVTWTARTATTITWTASPLYKSGATTPTFPTAVGATFTDNGITWTTRTPAITDKKCPQSKIAFAIASKIYSPYKDVTRYSATNSPRDWTTQDDAGFLPTGQHSPTSVETTAMAEYRGRLAIWTASHLQIWTVDPDPAENALFDSIAGIGTVYPKAVTSVSGDLFFTTKLGIRSVSIAAGAENLQTDDVGTPIDPLVQAKLAGPEMPIGMYYPGSGQFWMCFNSYDGGGSGGVGGGGITPLVLTCTPPNAILDAAYSYSYIASGGATPYTFSVEIGALPPGLTLNGATGVLSGVATTAGTYSFGVKVRDTRGVIAYCGGSAVVVQDQVVVQNAYLLVTGTEKTIDGPVFAKVTPALVVTGIPIATGADIAGTSPDYFSGTWIAVKDTSLRYSTNAMATWQTGTITAAYPIGPVVGLAGGWLVNGWNNLIAGASYTGASPAALTYAALTGNLSNGDPSSVAASTIAFKAEGQYYLARNANRALFRSTTLAGPFNAIWDVFKEVATGRDINGTNTIAGFWDAAKFGGEWYIIINWGFTGRRIKIIKCADITNLTTFTALVDVAQNAANMPAQLCVGTGAITAYCADGSLWTSANNWATPITTGLTTTGAVGDAESVMLKGGRRIQFTNGLFCMIGNTDKLVTFNPTTLAVSALITLPITNTVGIAAGFGA